MDFHERHDWDLTPSEAIALQKSLATEVNTSEPIRSYKTIAAADVSYNKFDPTLFAAVVVLDAKTFEVLESVGLSSLARFPYVPGLLSFREAPAVLEVFRLVHHVPDVLLCDGQGIAHPRGLGLASHLGLWLGLPTVGCAKSRLCGDHGEPGPERGDRSPLIVDGEVRGSVLRTRRNVKPLFVSPGHRCDRKSAERIVLKATGRFRLPEASRKAHEMVNSLRRQAENPPSAASGLDLSHF